MDIIKNIAAVAGLVLTLCSLIGIFTKGGRRIIQNLVRSNTADLQRINQEQNEHIQRIETSLGLLNQKVDNLTNQSGALEHVSLQELRETIKNIYYKYEATKKIPLYERKAADNAYELYYNMFHGNSYAKLLYEEICKWEIDTTNYPILKDD